MDRIVEIEDMMAVARQARRSGKTIGFVPTMGYFHDGHLQLMRVARQESDLVVVSLFVNPTQFGQGEDLAAYPRDLEGDAAKASSVGVDVLFTPRVEAMYPADSRTWVEVEGITEKLCGRSRPGHFRGVATVVSKLFHIVQPHRAYFGRKDYQQFLVIKRVTADLNWDLEIVGVEIVRDPDGLALSSRNVYLSPQQRRSALSLSRSLRQAQAMIDQGERRSEAILAMVEETISEQPEVRIDYVALCDPETLEEVSQIQKDTLLALAVFAGKARLIDNAVLKVPLKG